ncbi:MAG: hypothetical protein HYS83_02525 [Candidatus Blackburnbacteria bacterium]|nr:hypothetical protein [Candidatus Blackburnbacteria bacterium]
MRTFKRPQNGGNGKPGKFSFFIQGIISGFGWSFGATIGFAVVAGVIGQFFTDLRAAIDQLTKLRENLPK